MGSGFVISREEFEQTLQRVERLLGDVQGEAATLVDRSNRATSLLPDFLTVGLRESLVSFLDTLAQLFTVLADLLGSPGWPPGLYETGERWTNEVGATASALAGLAGVDQTIVDEKWKGPAARAYTQALAGQAKALNAIKSATDEIDDALWKMAAGLLACWLCLAAAIVGYVLELRTATAAAATMAGAPLAVAGAGLSTVKVLGIVGAVLTGLVALATTIITQYKDLNQRLTNNDGFADGWPRVDQAEMSDARITDADRATDWKLDY
jgi:uncharacterized protein YukE